MVSAIIGKTKTNALSLLFLRNKHTYKRQSPSTTALSIVPPNTVNNDRLKLPILNASPYLISASIPLPKGATESIVIPR